MKTGVNSWVPLFKEQLLGIINEHQPNENRGELMCSIIQRTAVGYNKRTPTK